MTLALEGVAAGEVVVEFEVVGVPAPAGSKTPRVGKRKDGSVFVNVVDGSTATQKEKRATWRSDVIAAFDEWLRASGRDTWVALDEPLSIEVEFRVARPRSAPKSVVYPAVRPDSGKLLRATEDALKVAGLVADDARFVDHVIRKRFATESARSGATIIVRTLRHRPAR